MEDKRDTPHGVLYGQVNKALRQGSFPSHRHAVAELYVCLGGRATDVLGGRVRVLSAGDILVHTGTGVHTQREMTDFRCCVFQFHLPLLLERAEAMGIAESEGFCALVTCGSLPPGEELYVGEDVLRLTEEMADMMRAEVSESASDALFLSLVAVLAAKCRTRGADAAAEQEDPTAAIHAYINAHYAEAITLPQLASLSHYSARHITRLFRARHGTSPMAYLDAVRIKEARRLLLTTGKSVSEIAALCGFPDSNLFSRHFRAHVGMSALSYRRGATAPRPTLSFVNILGEDDLP